MTTTISLSEDPPAANDRVQNAIPLLSVGPSAVFPCWQK